MEEGQGKGKTGACGPSEVMVRNLDLIWSAIDSTWKDSSWKVMWSNF